MPLLAVLFRRAEAGAAILVVAAVTVVLALDRDLVKPLSSLRPPVAALAGRTPSG